MKTLSQAADLRLPSRLAFSEVLARAKLSAILRSRARFLAAVRARTRLAASGASRGPSHAIVFVGGRSWAGLWMHLFGIFLCAVAAVMPQSSLGATSQASCFPVTRRVVAIADDRALAEALRDAHCGTTLALETGTYRDDVAIRLACPSDRPLVIRSDEPQGARLAGQIRVLGEHISVAGLTIQGGEIEIAGTGNRITRNRFITPSGLVVRAAVESRIDHNEFSSPPGRGIDIAFKFSKDGKRPARGIRVDANLFQSRSGNVAEAEDEPDEEKGVSIGIYLGQFSARKGRQDMLDYGRVGVVVEGNLFIDYERRRAIHVKSLGNIIRGNNFIDTRRSAKWSRVTIRHGQFNDVSDNLMDGTAGLQIFEENNSASGNVLTEGAQLLVMGGGGEMTQFGGPQQRQAVGTRLVSNSGPLKIGAIYAQRANKMPATDTVVEGHQGPIETLLEQNTVIRDGPRAASQLPHLTTADVGLTAKGYCPGS